MRVRIQRDTAPVNGRKQRRPLRPMFAVTAVMLAVGVMAWAGGASGAASSSNEKSTRAATGQLRIAQISNGTPERFDPTLFWDNRTVEMGQNVWQPLVDIDEHLRIVPALAQSWKISRSGTVYTFKLRKNVRFQNGDPFTAADVIYSFTRSLIPSTGSDTAFFLSDILGADAVSSGKKKTVSGLRALDPYTLQITLKKPAGYFLSVISRWSAWVVNKKVVVKYGKNWVKPGNSTGTGPYRLVGQTANQRYDFAVFDGYWGLKPRLSQVTWFAVSDSTAALARYEAGDFDVVVDLAGASVAKVQADATLRKQFHSKPYLRTVWLGWSLDKPPFDKLLVRQAFAHAIDRSALVKTALLGQGVPANGWLPPGLPGNVNGTRAATSYDPALARKLLAQAGYPDGKGFPDVELAFNDALGSQERVFELLQAQLKSNLGVEVKLQLLPSSTFYATMRDATKRPRLWGNSFGFDYPDAQEAFQYLKVTGAVYNYEQYSNKTFDALVAQSSRSNDQRTRAELHRRAENRLLDDLAVLPLYYPVRNWLVKPYVRGFGMTPLYARKWTQITVGKRP